MDIYKSVEINKVTLGVKPRSCITLLGTGTCQLQHDRMACSVLLALDHGCLLYDCGRGVCQRLAELGLRNNDVAAIVFFHFHPDPVSDLIPLLHAACWSRVDPRTTDLTIIGPRGLRNQVMRMMSLFGDDSLNPQRFEIHLREIREDHFEILGESFGFIDLPPAGSRGLMFKKGSVTSGLTGDSNYHGQLVDFVKHLDVAVIDAGHPTKEEIVDLAVQTNVPLLLCSHLYAELDEQELQHAAHHAGYRGRIMVGEDLMQMAFE